MITRFAPSPTGLLHLGHAYAAWVAWSQARQSGGRFLLRWEDIDPVRCRPEYEVAILEDLAWLGLEPDEPVIRQSDRFEVYAQALERLSAMGLLYPCFCTRKDIQDAGGAPHGPEGPVYPGTCKQLAQGERQAKLDAAEPYALRLDMAAAAARIDGPLLWHDRRLGEQRADPLVFGDVVLARKETPTSYHLAVSIDDDAQGVTLVTRGEDLRQATDIHRLLQALLGLDVPEWHHHRLIVDSNGQRLATRNKATALRQLREQGFQPRDVWDQLGVDGTN